MIANLLNTLEQAKALKKSYDIEYITASENARSIYKAASIEEKLNSLQKMLEKQISEKEEVTLSAEKDSSEEEKQKMYRRMPPQALATKRKTDSSFLMKKRRK